MPFGFGGNKEDPPSIKKPVTDNDDLDDIK